MSFAAQTWARKLTVGNGIAKAVLRHLADVADGGGYSHYGFEALCREVEFTPRAVAKAIVYLIERGLLDKQERKSPKGKCLAPCWRVLIPGTAPADSHPFTSRESAPPHDAAPPANPHPLSPCESVSVPPANSQGNPTSLSKEGRKNEVLRTSAPASQPDADAQDDEAKLLWQEGVAIAQRLRKPSDPSANAIVGRLRKLASYDDAAVLTALRAAEQTPPLHLLSWVTRVIQNGIDPLPAQPRAPDPSRVYGPPGASMRLRRELAEMYAAEEAAAREALA